MESFSTVLERNKGIGPGFDFVRLALALGIVLFHSILLTGNIGVRNTPLWFLEYALVPCFFALSGFLVTASGLRLSLRNFVVNRSLRIIPALAVDVLFCTLIVGPLFTSLSLSDYFKNPEFALYYLNVFGYIHYLLPGTFSTHFDPYVNGALWTVPYEILCYTIICTFIGFKYLEDVRKVFAFTALIFICGLFFEYTGVLEHARWRIKASAHLLFIDRESQLLTAFLCGVLAYHLKSRIKYDIKVFYFCLCICVAAAFVLDQTATNDVLGRIILLPAITYMTLFAGLTNIRLPKIIGNGDYSYGIYLYHDPLLQALLSVFPALAFPNYRNALFLYMCGVASVSFFAICSWHLIEKPILGFRKRFSFLARVRGI